MITTSTSSCNPRALSGSAARDLSRCLLSRLAPIHILPRRFLLDTGGIVAGIPMLRGVWGAALHKLDIAAYRTVFAPQSSGKSKASPLFVLRPAPMNAQSGPAIEWISIGAALPFDPVLRRGWLCASQMGLGPHRQPFRIRQVLSLACDASCRQDECWEADATSPITAWSLGDAVWPGGDPASPCILVFNGSLRLRRHGRLLEQPALPDLIAAAARRIEAFLPEALRDDWQLAANESLTLARSTPAGVWQGTRLNLHRYSARQEAELELHGVAGSLELPQGPGELWPLLAAAQWLHLGKGTVMGMGQMEVVLGQ